MPISTVGNLSLPLAVVPYTGKPRSKPLRWHHQGCRCTEFRCDSTCILQATSFRGHKRSQQSAPGVALFPLTACRASHSCRSQPQQHVRQSGDSSQHQVWLCPTLTACQVPLNSASATAKLTFGSLAPVSSASPSGSAPPSVVGPAVAPPAPNAGVAPDPNAGAAPEPNGGTAPDPNAGVVAGGKANDGTVPAGGLIPVSAAGACGATWLLSWRWPARGTLRCHIAVSASLALLALPVPTMVPAAL